MQIWFQGMVMTLTHFGVPECLMHLDLLLENFNPFHSWSKV